MFDLLAEVPGTVVLHDFFLGDVLSDIEDKEPTSRPWTLALYESRGYRAVVERFHAKDTRDVVLRYPANLDVVRRARGVIVHSQYACQLACEWYGADVGRAWAVVPHPRKIETDGAAIEALRRDPAACADAYRDVIERFHEEAGTGPAGLLSSLAKLDINARETRQVAAAMASNHPALRSARRLFIDVSELVQRDARTGIQRVTRSILQVLLSELPKGFRVESVYATPTSAGFRFARRFTLGMCACPSDWMEDEPVDPQVGDIFLGLDLNQTITAAQRSVLAGYSALGVRVYDVVYDLLPVLRPDCYPAGAHDAHSRWLDIVTRFDGVIAISRAVADELVDWMKLHGPPRHRPLRISWWHLGADVAESAGAGSLPLEADEVCERLRSGPTFLIVSTIEPRKGHAQTLATFERLWSAGVDVRLALVGKKGWMVDDLVARIESHPEIGRRLFWLKGISDGYLEKIYAASTCLLAPSEGEGFGLFLIEAARHGLPILARDIPVFREVAGDHASYFTGLDADTLTGAIRDWLSQVRQDRHRRSDEMPWLTWEESTRQLLDVILQNRWPMRWPLSSKDEAEPGIAAR